MRHRHGRLSKMMQYKSGSREWQVLGPAAAFAGMPSGVRVKPPFWQDYLVQATVQRAGTVVEAILRWQ
jgi:hypothetical protein